MIVTPVVVCAIMNPLPATYISVFTFVCDLLLYPSHRTLRRADWGQNDDKIFAQTWTSDAR